MAADERRFTCVIEDHVLHERFSANVTVRKKCPVRSSLQKGRIDLADVFITPVSGQPPIRVHHHFVLYDFTGKGLYIVRDQLDRDEHKRSCSAWDLGHSFGIQVLAAQGPGVKRRSRSQTSRSRRTSSRNRAATRGASNCSTHKLPAAACAVRNSGAR
jgi:hypothetical protein